MNSLAMKIWWLSSLLVSMTFFVPFAMGAPKFTFNPSDLKWLEAEEPQVRLEWQLGLEGRSIEEGEDEIVMSRTMGRARIQYRLAPVLKFKGEMELNFISSRIQAQYDNYGSQPSYFRAREAVLSLQPTSGFEIQGGAISQSLGNRLDLIVDSSSAFPGARETFSLPVGGVEISFSAQQTVPTSKSLNVDRAEKEELPTFFTERFGLTMGRDWPFSGEIFALHYNYRDLPAVVAFESGRMGNETSGETQANAYFLNGFEGYVYGGASRLRFASNWSLEASGYLVENNKAPTTLNRGQWVQGGLRFENSSLEVNPFAAYFFSEPDVAPASYVSSSLGRTNREGQQVGLDLSFKKYKFKVQLAHINADAINTNPNQDEFTYWTLKVETFYVTF